MSGILRRVARAGIAPGLLASMLAAASAGAAAQQTAAAATPRSQTAPERPAGAASTLAAPVRLEVEGVTLAAALQELVRAGVPLTYSTELVRGAASVRCRCTGVPLGTALEQLMRGTGIGFRETRTGEVVLFRVPQAAGGVQGRVTVQADGSALASATVQLVGTGHGTLARADGSYSIENVPAGQYWIRASRVGFHPDSQRVEIRDGATATADFALVVAPVSLSPLEVTVSTGTLIDTKRRALGTSIAVLDADQIERSGATGIFDLLQGAAPGVAAFQPNALNGGGGFLRIRGSASILGDQAPLIYIDGVPVDNGSAASNLAGDGVLLQDAAAGAHTRLQDLSLDQIERIEVVKGSAATTMYGTEAINGVIQIFTKRGVAGQTRISARTEQGTARIGIDDSFVGASPFGDRLRALLQTSHTQRYGANVSGGVQSLTYTLGVDHQRDAGVVVGNAARQTSAHGSLTPLSGEKLSLRLSGSLLQRSYESLDYNTLFEFADSETGGLVGLVLGIESVEEALRRGTRMDTEVQRMIASADLGWRPVDFWQNQVTFGLDISDELEERYGQPLREFADDFQAENIRRDFNRLSGRYVGTLSYPADGPVASTLSVGAEGYRSEVRHLWIRGTGLPGGGGGSRLDFAEDLTGAYFAPIQQYSAVATIGLFAQEQVGIYDKLFLTAGVRADGSSAFGDSYGMQVYPKLAASYVVEPVDWWSGKVRAAWGRSGKLPAPFAKVRTFDVRHSDNFGWPMIHVDDFGNEHLKPEVGTEIELGVENYFFGDRASLEANYWRQTTRDALLRGRIPLIYGFSDPLANIAGLRSSGFELAGNVTRLARERTRVTLGATLTRLVENGVVTDLGGDDEYGAIGNLYLGLKEGESIHAVTYLSGIDDSRVYVGSRVPTTYGGANADVEWNGVRFFTNLSYGFGGTALDYVRTVRDAESGFLFDPYSFDPGIVQRYLVPTDYARLEVARLAYQLPARLIGRLSAAELWVEGRNLYTWDRWEGGDVTTISPVGTGDGEASIYLSGALPRGFSTPRSYSIGARVTF